MPYFLILFFLLLLSSSALAKPNTISLDFDHVEIRSAIQLIADFAHVNLAFTDDVKGNISLHVTHVYWEEALDLLLKTQGLDKQQIGKTLLIAKSSDLLSQAKQNYQLRQQADEFAPLITRTIPVHYANAKDLLAILKEKNNGILSDRGRILADERTHVIWLKDTEKQIDDTSRLIRQLDVPLKQVMIEARIVNVDRSFERDLGLRFTFSKGIESNNDEKSSSKKDDVQISSLSTMGEVAPSLGMFVAKLGQGVLLDVQLAALENEGKGEFISNPKLLTQDQKTAFIQAGEEIPFQEKARNGGTSVIFKKAVLSLEVTPKILPRNQLLLDLKVNQDAPGVHLNGDIPMIDTRQIETHVQVKSGQTLVLGGILESNKRRQANRVPFLSDIPLVGRLFQEQGKSGEQRELLVFITPSIVE